MPEGVLPYPRWEGSTSDRSRIPVMIGNEIRRALWDRWSMIALVVGVGWGLASIIEFYQLRELGNATHDYEGLIAMLRQLMWFSLAAAAAVGGPMLLDDSKTNALELYLSRSVTTKEYLLSKILGLGALTVGLLLIPSVLYWGASYVFYDERPDTWGRALLPILGVSFAWGVMVSGLALGFSAMARSAAGAALVLLGGFVTLDLLVDPPGILQRVATITQLTEDTRFAIISPFSSVEAMMGPLFDTDPIHTFPLSWGIGAWALLTAIGWTLVAWKHPQPKGMEGSR